MWNALPLNSAFAALFKETPKGGRRKVRNVYITAAVGCIDPIPTQIGWHHWTALGHYLG